MSSAVLVVIMEMPCVAPVVSPVKVLALEVLLWISIYMGIDISTGFESSLLKIKVVTFTTHLFS